MTPPEKEPVSSSFSELKPSMVRGFYWASLGQLVPLFARFLGGIFLARTIDPVLFGQQALAYATTSLIWAFVMLGEQPAILRRKTDVDEYISVILWTRCCIIFLLSVAITLFWMLGMLPGSRIVQLHALIFFFCEIPSQIAAIYGVYLYKILNFRALSLISIISSVFGVLVACSLAYLDCPVAALMFLIIGERLMLAILTFLVVPRWFMPRFNEAHFRDFIHFAKYLFATGILDRIGSKLVDISIGSVIGELKLGFYQRATSLASLLQTLLAGGLNDVIQPYFSKLQENRSQLGSDFEFISCLLMRITTYIFSVAALFMPLIVNILYGEKWQESVPLFRALLPFAILQSYRTTLRWTHQVVGSPRNLVVAQLSELGSLLILLYLLVGPWGVTGAAIAIDISVIIAVLLMLAQFKKYAEFGIVKIFLTPISAAILAYVILGLFSFSGESYSSLIGAIPAFLSFTAVYVGILFIFEYRLTLRISNLMVRIALFRHA